MNRKRVDVAAFVALVCLICIVQPLADAYLQVEISSWGPGFTGSSTRATLAKNNMQVACSFYAHMLEGNVPVYIYVQVTDPWPHPAGAMARCLPGEWYLRSGSSWPGYPFVNTMYPVAQVNQVDGWDVYPEGSEIVLEFNPAYFYSYDFFYEYWKPCPIVQHDFLMIALHELGHGFGFMSQARTSPPYGEWLEGYPSTFDQQLAWTPTDPPSLWYWFVTLPVSIRGDAMRSGSSAGLYSCGPYVSFYGYYYLRFVDPGIDFETGLAQMYAPYVTTPSISHWDPIHANPEQLMEPELARGDFIRDFGLLRDSLADMGWELTPGASRWPSSLKFIGSVGAKTGSSNYVMFSNHTGDNSVIIEDVILSGDDAVDFSISSPHTGVYINSMGLYQIWIDFSPSIICLKFAHATIEYRIGTGPIQTFDVALTGIALGVDTDDDGISNTDEVAPFDPGVDDSTGDFGDTSPDGFPDGMNDFDGDGMNNQDECLLGYDPFLATSYGNPQEGDKDGDGISDTDETGDIWGMPNPTLATAIAQATTP